MNKEQEIIYKCSIPECEKNAKFRCSLCHNFFVCELMVHNAQWDKHKKTCPKLPQKRKIEYDKIKKNTSELITSMY